MSLKSKIALFPGSFDPITKGHEDIVIRALAIFDKIIIGIGENSKKQKLFSFEQRKYWVEKTFQSYSNVSVIAYTGITALFCKTHDINAIVRGVRNASDFEFEQMVSAVNKNFYSDLETCILFSAPELMHINSSIVRELYFNQADVSSFTPSAIDIYQQK